ncbi:hypothetical protein C8T65DRAFT_657552 [Cerioporus squamosus]|nr:hypothetical protein C8T65DRAFT_657552 [Cerioporus squamosus]
MPLAITDSHSEEVVLQHPACGDSLRHCNSCFKRETTGVKLRKCGGCAKVVYCSLECQKAEWPRHKPTCMGGTAEDAATVARYGYASVSAFARDLQDFLDANTWAFRMLITVQRQLQLDANPGVPFSELPKLLRFRLRCQTTRSDTHKHRNPATRFALLSYTFDDVDAYARKNELWWEQGAVIRDDANCAFTRQYPRHVGDFFAAEYTVPGTNAGAMDHFPLQTPSWRTWWISARGASTRASPCACRSWEMPSASWRTPESLCARRAAGRGRPSSRSGRAILPVDIALSTAALRR